MKKTLLLAVVTLLSLNLKAQSGGTSYSVSSAVYSISDGSTVTKSGQTWSSTTADENVVQVTKGTLTMTDCTITKASGNCSNSDASSFYGTNSAVYVNGSSSTITMTGGTITSSATGVNGGFAYDSGTLNISDVTIKNTGNLSRGIHATGGGIINASNLSVTTSGSNSSVIATDRGGGTVTVNGGSYVTTGTDCAITYSTGTITVTDATGSSSKGEIGVIEGDNSITLNNCTMSSSSSSRGMMILQSGSGDSEGYNGAITVNGGTMTVTNDVPLCEIPTNITGTLTLKDVTLVLTGDTLMKVAYNSRWSTKGGTGNLVLSSGDYTGTVYADSYGTVNVTVASGATWTLTSNTTVGTLTNNGTVYTNGYTLSYTTKSGSGTISTGTGISTVTSEPKQTPAYTIDGRRAGASTRGIIIQNGKKTIKNRSL